MEPAPEFRPLVERMLKNWIKRDPAAVIDLISREPGSLVIGTDPEEWWDGYDTVSTIFKIQFQEMTDIGGFGPENLDPNFFRDFSAWKEGSVGWVSFRVPVEREGGGHNFTRFTLVLHEEGSFWRAVQWHASIGVQNEEISGHPLTTSVDGILTSLHDAELPANATSGDGSVTIMFTDIEGSTSLMESLGESEWLDLLDWHDRVVTHQSRVFGGKVIKGQGDGFMIAFPATGSAAACAVAIQKSLSTGWTGVAVPVRIGLHRGNVRSEGGDFFGRTVVLAARIAGAAGGSEILVSQAVQEDLDGAFSLDEARSLSVKGLAGTYTVFPLAWR